MQRLGTLAAALLMTIAVGCRDRPTQPPGDGEGVVDEGTTPAVPAMPTQGFAVLPWGTRVYVEPRVGGLSAELGAPFVPPPPWPSSGHVVRVLGMRDGLVEIAPLLHEQLQQGRHCGLALEGNGFDVRLYVSPWSLAQVLTREHEEIDDEGRRLALRPGVVVQRIPEDREGVFAIAASGLLIRAPLPEDAIGRVYERPQPLEVSFASSWQIDGQRMTYRGWPLVFDRTFGSDATIESVLPDGEGHRLEVANHCARVTAHAAQVPPHAPPEPHFEFGLGAPDVVLPPVALVEGLEPIEPVEPPQELEFIELDGVDGIEGELLRPPALRRHEWVFEEGAPIYLSVAGPAAGTLAGARVFGEDGWIASDRLCFHTGFGARFLPALAVCLDGAEGRQRDPATDHHDFHPQLVRPRSLHVRGALDRPQMERAMRIHRHELRRCAYRAGPPEGTLVLTFTVRPSGKSSAVEVHTTSSMGAMNDCVKDAAARWVLPAPTDGKPARVELSVEIGRNGSGGGVG